MILRIFIRIFHADNTIHKSNKSNTKSLRLRILLVERIKTTIVQIFNKEVFFLILPSMPSLSPIVHKTSSFLKYWK